MIRSTCAFTLSIALTSACSSSSPSVPEPPNAGGDESLASPTMDTNAASPSPDEGEGVDEPTPTEAADGVEENAGAPLEVAPSEDVSGGDAPGEGDPSDGMPADDAEEEGPVEPEGPAAVDPGTEGDGNFVIDTFSMQPELTNQGAPTGRNFNFQMDSTESEIFDGSDPTLDPAKPRLLTRNIAVYVPPTYVDGTEAPILVMQDGPGGPRNSQFDAVSRALDNMTISSDPARRIPAFLLIAVQNGGNDAQGSERGLEYDTLSDRYARFVELEVLPAVISNPQIRGAYPGIAITDDPEGRAAMGCSSGGAAAFTMVWFRPDLFRRAITYSGTFVAQQNRGQPESPVYPLGAWEYHSSLNLIGNTDPAKPIRVFLNVNGQDNGFNAPENGYHNWVLANDYMAEALAEKGYHYRYVVAEGIGHCDGRAWQSTLADTLAWTWAGYPTD